MSKKGHREDPNPFHQAVSNTPDLGEDAYCLGLRALTDKHRECIKPGTAQILGSVNLDAALCPRYPDASRWDYAIGMQKNNSSYAIWIEFHPANTSNVEEVLEKLRWLKEWLSSKAPKLHLLTPPRAAYHWLATGGVHITRNSRQARQLAQAGLMMPRKVLNLDTLEL
jgi:hypothetical protein